MRLKILKVIMVLLLLGLNLAACASNQPAITQVVEVTATSAPPVSTAEPEPSPAASPAPPAEPIYLSIIWHQHQPVYYKDPESGIYAKPWVRLHAAKDYVDMAEMVGRYPNVRVAFNLTPSLLRQIQDLRAGAKDAYWVATEVPASQLSVEDKRFLLRRFFDINPKIIQRFPRYVELNTKRGDVGSDEQADAVAERWNEQDFRDLQVLFNLGWTDPDYLAEEPLKSLVAKGRNFSEEDKATVLQRHVELIERVIPVHAELQQRGQIEITTTPYAHPILPLLIDTTLAKQAMPEADLPVPPFRYGQDARGQLERGIELYRELFGQPPRGMWPAEGSVAQAMVTMVAEAGIQWMATDEEVLAKSIGLGQFTRNSAETVQEADQLYRPYYVTGAGGQRVAVVFRDRTISDKVGFTYSGVAGASAADDFIQRIEHIRQQLAGKPGPHLVTVILDGENAWEHYANDGKEFLTTLYERLSTSATIKTITPGEYIKLFPEQPEIKDLWAGSWISADFSTWIGEDEENKAWQLLRDSRATLQKYITGQRKGQVSEEQLQKATDLMYIAEGSDWFWWYGSDQDSGDDGAFDQQFRDTLIEMHQVLGAEVPAELYVSVLPARPTAPDIAAQGPITVTVDGVAAPGEWDAAGRYSAAGGVAQRADDIIGSLFYGFSPTTLFVRLDARNSWSDLGTDGSLGIYIGSTKARQATPFSRFGAGGKTILGFDAGYVAEVRLDSGAIVGEATLAAATDKGWPPVESLAGAEGIALQAALEGQIIEVAIPITALGELEVGDVLGLRVIASRSGADIQLMPADGPAQITLPDLGLTTTILSVKDPERDDHGPGSYTYPTDGVFKPGVFDLTEFTVAEDEKNLIFKFDLRGQIENVWNSPRGISVQTFDIYIDTGEGGARKLLPGRNAAVAEGGWEYVLWLEGWEGGLFRAQGDGPPEKITGVEIKTIVDGPNGRVTIRLPKNALPQGDPQQWRYLAAVLGQEGFPATGVWRVRDVNPAAEQWRFGGALPGTNGTRIIDIALAEDSAITQEQALTPPATLHEPNADAFRPEDLAQVPMLAAQ